MKGILLSLFVVGFSAHAQVSTYNYLEFCDKIVVNSDNSVHCLHTFFKDLQQFKKNPDFRFRYFESYNCVQQPDPKSFNRVNGGTSAFYKPLASELWKLYNDMYAKGGEIVVFVRLEDYKTDLEKGFRLVREMQQLQTSIAEVRNKIANKISTDAKSAPASAYTKPYQLFLNAILHEENLIRKLAQNFNEETYTGFAQEEILKSYLETDDLLQNLKPSNFRLPDMAALKSCYEGFELIQKTKLNSLDNFNNTDTFDGQHANDLYDNLLNYFNTDILYFFSYLSQQGRLNYYPLTARQYDLNAPPKPWSAKHLEYSAASPDSIVIAKQPAPLPLASFNEFNLVIYYINECVGSLENLYKELRSEEYTWNNLRKRKGSTKANIIKFENFKIPVTSFGLVTKNSKNMLASVRPSIMRRVDDLQQIMLVMQDKLMGLSLFMRSGPFDEKSPDFVDQEIKSIELLYTEFDIRKEKLYLEVRKAHGSYPIARTNSWTTASGALLKGADDSRKVLRQVERRLYDNNEGPIPTTNIHEDRRDLITNQLKYLKGVVDLGGNNGNNPYSPYDFIAGYLNTIEEKVLEFPPEVKNKNEKYGDFVHMHNLIIYRYNQFAELALGDNEYGRNDPMRPVYILSDIYQPMKYRFNPPPPEVKKEEPLVVPETPVVVIQEAITFEGYPFNNMVLLLDVSSSMNTPQRLPQLKKSFEQLVKLMRTEDEVSIVIYSGKATVLLPPTSASDTTKIIRAIQNLKSDGKTNIADGLTLAYKTARKNFKSDGNNRIILATDGEFNAGESLNALAEKNSSEIPLTVFDFSQKIEPIKSIQTLAEKGKGNYVKVTPENSLEVLVGEAKKH